MWFLELHYTNGKVIRLPEPYYLWMDAERARGKIMSPFYTVCIVQD